MSRLREALWILRGTRLDRLPYTGDWMATCSAHGRFFESRREALRWIVKTAWEDAGDTVKTRRSLRSQGLPRG